MDVAKRLAGVLCTQILPFCDQRVLDLFTSFETEMYERPTG